MTRVFRDGHVETGFCRDRDEQFSIRKSDFRFFEHLLQLHDFTDAHRMKPEALLFGMSPHKATRQLLIPAATILAMPDSAEDEHRRNGQQEQQVSTIQQPAKD